MDKVKEERNLVCVLFPGIVKNEEKALQCLGGNRGISEVYSNISKKRLGLNFQPDNPFINKIYADVSKSTGVLLKVRVKKTMTQNGTKRDVISTDIVGRVSTIFKFEGMGDFQYLPVHTEEDKKPQCIREQILPTDLASLDFLTQDAVIYMTPTVFTRTDKPWPYQYTYRKQITQSDEVVAPTSSSILAKPPAPTFVNFNLTEKFPTEPTEWQVAAKERKVRHNAKEEVAKVIQALEERPIWSMNAIAYHTKIQKSNLRFILPAFAYYFTNGPWRRCWTKYGYDPRREPYARRYQVLDFRVRGALTAKVSTRQVEKRLANSVCQGSNAPLSQDRCRVSEGSVVFRPGVQLTQRQIFYQFCDIDIPEVSSVVSAAPAAGALCHAALGWLPAGFAQLCRDHVVRYSKQALIGGEQDFKYENPSSDDDGNSDEDGDPDYTNVNTSTEIDETNT